MNVKNISLVGLIFVSSSLANSGTTETYSNNLSNLSSIKKVPCTEILSTIDTSFGSCYKETNLTTGNSYYRFSPSYHF